MLIETYEHTYAVVQHYYSGLYLDRYVCKQKSDGQFYTIVRIRNKKIMSKAIEFLCDQKKNRKFTDLKDQFVYQGDLHVVFRCARGIPLLRKLEEQGVLEERLQIGGKILEQLILQQQPSYFQCQCLEPENILVTNAGDVSFLYTLEDLENYQSYSREQMAAYLYRIFSIMFEPELKRHVLEPMEGYLKWLQEAAGSSDLELYEEYSRICGEIAKIPEEEMAMDKGLLFHFMRLFRAIRVRLKKALMALIFLGVFFYMVYNIYRSFQIPGYVRHFESIGTMQLTDGDEGNEVFK